ncbi:MAG: mechanosensitive ion channel family protein [Sphingomonas sp.]
MINTTAVPLLPPGRTLQAQLAGFFADAGAWVQTHWLNILIAGAIAAVVVLALHLVRAWALRLCRRGDGVANWYAIVGRAIGKTGNFFMLMTALRLVDGYANAPVAINATIAFLFTIAAVFQGAIWLREIIFGVVENRTLAEGESAATLSSALGIIRLLVTIILFALAVVVVLSNVGVNVTGLVAGLGVGGIAIGLAAQGIFADLFAALAILFDRPFRIGDTISYDTSGGVVEGIGLKSTRLRGATGEERIIANKKLLDNEIFNTTRRLHNRFRYTFSLGYQTSPEIVEALPALLREAVESEGHTLVHGGLIGFGKSGLDYDVEFESKGTDFAADARDKVAAAILTRFRARGIAFAYPTQLTLIAPETQAAEGADEAA